MSCFKKLKHWYFPVPRPAFDQNLDKFSTSVKIMKYSSTGYFNAELEPLFTEDQSTKLCKVYRLVTFLWLCNHFDCFSYTHGTSLPDLEKIWKCVLLSFQVLRYHTSLPVTSLFTFGSCYKPCL